MNSDLSDTIHIIPVKLTGIIFALSIGTALYYGRNRIPLFEVYRRSIKYLVIIIILIIIGNLIKLLLLRVGIDITPFLGFF